MLEDWEEMMIGVRTYVDVSSGQNAALIEGAPERGTILLVPGYTGSKEDFLPLLKPLAKQGFRTVAIDQRGQYSSSWAPDPAGYRLPSLAEDVVEVARSLDDGPVHLVGHSFGGLVCRDAVLAAPARFRSLILMSSGPSAISGDRRTVLTRAVSALRAGSADAAWEVLLPRHSSAAADPLQQAGHERFLSRRFHANDPVGLLTMADEVFAATDRVDELAAAGVPVLVVFGTEDDSWTPQEQRSMAVRLGATVAEIPGVGHAPATSDPDATVAAMTAFYDGEA